MFLRYKFITGIHRVYIFASVIIMERASSPAIFSRPKIMENFEDRIITELIAKDASRKTHDDFVARSRESIKSCQHKIVHVREKLASLDIKECGQEGPLSLKKGLEGENITIDIKTTCGNKPKNPANSQEVEIKRKTDRFITQRSSSFEDPSYLKQKTNRRQLDTSTWTPFSRHNTEQISWPEGSCKTNSIKEQTASKVQTTLPRLAIRRGSDPVAARKIETPKSRSSEKICEETSKARGDMYHGSLFRVLRHSMSAFEPRPRSCNGHVWQKSNEAIISDSSLSFNKCGLQPQPPSKPRILTRSSSNVTPHQLSLIHENHKALLGRQQLIGRPVSFRNRTTTI